jgi:predicted dehydrogenase
MAIKLGILGTGAFANCFVGLFRDHPLIASVSLCEQVPEKLAAAAAKFGIARTFASYEELLGSDVDAVAIFTQHWMHAPQAVRAFEAGKHVYSAVPTAASLDETRALIAAVERSGKLYMMGETSAYRPDSIYCRERHARGDFGRIVYAQAEYFHDWDHGLYEVNARRFGPDWRSQGRERHPMAYPTHTIGHVVSVTGAHPRTVSCVGVRDTKAEDADLYHERSPFSNQIAVFSMSDGSAMRTCEMRRIGHAGCERLSLYGTEAGYEGVSDGRLWVTKQKAERLDPQFAPEHAESRRRQARLPAALRSDRGHGGSHAYLVDDFAKACAWNLQPRVNVWQAARYYVPGLIAIQSSMQGGKLLEVPDFGAGPAVDHAAFERCADVKAASARS